MEINKAKRIALSTMESEFIALVESVRELVWFSNVLGCSNINNYVKRKSIQFCDNESAIHYSKNSVGNIKTKHIDIELQFIRDWIKLDKFELKYTSSKSNIADFLTKPISQVSYKKILFDYIFLFSK